MEIDLLFFDILRAQASFGIVGFRKSYCLCSCASTIICLSTRKDNFSDKLSGLESSGSHHSQSSLGRLKDLTLRWELEFADLPKQCSRQCNWILSPCSSDLYLATRAPESTVPTIHPSYASATEPWHPAREFISLPSNLDLRRQIWELQWSFDALFWALP